ncbi:[citrate (pro-3S)-lyase] ligase [Clostridium estertheticum]|uniref:[citrate (pro-3S)-lyase] ligase n=1 Tax=Clostridium estertheticum TaxID=238834 RepID=UPI001C0DB054|nr:[citrate (pro-3S)-lyase] ligase [Clostridium estertheticum]MBU3071854.1 [citrate (pro-3S)-lyase] ligase [Clostridium estertheticum]MBU3161946.1 [citrate (pro-3S)-lyase] ligase [Clostridium estertheticum]
MGYLNLDEIIIEDNHSSKLYDIKKLLLKQGLKFEENVEYTVALYDDDKIIATGSSEGKILKCIAVDDNYKQMGISNTIISDLISEQYRRGNNHLFVYTKPKNYKVFQKLGFYMIAEVPNRVILLENDPCGIKKYINNLKKEKISGDVISSVVVNCNPFTLGHKYLIEKASRESDVVHVFIVSEDKSVFPSDIRYKLVKEGLSHLKNVILHKSQNYIISNATFPSYFMKKQNEAVKTHCLLDILIFMKYIVPALGINKRYVGEESLCPVTKIYNDTMKEMLPKDNVEVIEIPRIQIGGNITSASTVRKLIKENKFLEVRKLVPDTTYNFLMSREGMSIIKKI